MKRKKELFENKLKECIGKPKDLWKTTKLLGLPNKSDWCTVCTLAEKQIVKHDTKSILIFLEFLFEPDRKLTKHPKPPSRQVQDSDYYKKLALSENC